jgi:arginine exporter protein ArgO
MNSLINWFNNLSRNTRILLVVAVCLFTPVVSVAFTILFGGISAAFSIIGFVLSMLNWKGVLFFLIVGMFFAAKAGYTWVMDEDEDDTDSEDDTLSWY